MKMIQIFTVVAFVMICAGCNNYSSPEAVIGSAAKALQKNDAKSFKRHFTREFRKSHDMALVMKDVAQKLNGVQVSLGQPVVLVLQEQLRSICRNDYFEDFRRVPIRTSYSVTIEDKNSPLMRAEVDCASVYVERHRRQLLSGSCFEYAGDTCRISELK